MSMPRFWMVLGCGTPVYRHSSKESAVKEAERLAMLSPGDEFVVLEAIAACKKSDVQWREFEPEERYDSNQAIPF